MTNYDKYIGMDVIHTEASVIGRLVDREPTTSRVMTVTEAMGSALAMWLIVFAILIPTLISSPEVPRAGLIILTFGVAVLIAAISLGKSQSRRSAAAVPIFVCKQAVPTPGTVTPAKKPAHISGNTAPCIFTSREDALNKLSDYGLGIYIHNKGGTYMKLIDNVEWRETVDGPSLGTGVFYRHVYPHPENYFWRPKALFDEPTRFKLLFATKKDWKGTEQKKDEQSESVSPILASTASATTSSSTSSSSSSTSST